jgi:hypothetical protein
METGTVLGSLSLVDGLRLAGVIAVWLGPGAALAMVWRWEGPQPNLTLGIPVAFAFATAFYSIVLAGLIWVSVALTPTALIGLGVLGWTIAGWTVMRSGWQFGRVPSAAESTRFSAAAAPIDKVDGAVWLVVALVVAVSLWSIRGTYAGVGSDSYHHTLIAGLIADQGRLPEGYGPQVPLITFSYHFGFHGVIGLWSMLSGLDAIVLMPIGAQILRAVGIWAVGSLAWLLFGRKTAALIAIVIAGLVSIFPALAYNWGRFPQMWALGMCAVWVGLWASRLETRRTPGESLLLGVLAAGIALTHYRVTLFTLTGVAAFGLIHGGLQRGSVRALAAAELGTVGWTIFAALAGVAPWLAQVVLERSEGYSLVAGTASSGAFDLGRLGPVGLNYPTNLLLLVLLGLVMIWVIRTRELVLTALLVWVASALALSQPWALGDYMDTITVVISLFLPGSVAIAGMLTAAWEADDRRWRALAAGAAGLLGLGALWGAWSFGNLIQTNESYLQGDDLVAAAWIQDHTPPDSLWMVNTFSFPFFPELVFGSDGGYWLPLTADRATITLPMTFSIERGQEPGLSQRLLILNQLGSDLTTPPALAQLEAYGITHIYLGQRGGPIDPVALSRSPHFERLYQLNSVSVFRFLP